MENELTYKSAMKHLKNYWPSGSRFSAELMVELVDGLKAKQWTWDDFVEAVNKYREHWNNTMDEKFHKSPDLGQLLRIHTPKGNVRRKKVYLYGYEITTLELYEKLIQTYKPNHPDHAKHLRILATEKSLTQTQREKILKDATRIESNDKEKR